MGFAILDEIDPACCAAPEDLRPPGRAARLPKEVYFRYAAPPWAKPERNFYFGEPCRTPKFKARLAKRRRKKKLERAARKVQQAHARSKRK